MRPRTIGMLHLASICARHPVATLAAAAVIVGLAIFSITRMEVASSLTAMFGTEGPASRAMVRIAEDYHASDELLLLVTAGATDDPHRALADFAARLDHAIEADPHARSLVSQVRWRIDEAWADFVRDVLVPAAPYYLSDEGFETLLERLTLDGMRGQLRRNEALLATPGPAASEIAREVLKDPLRIAELVDAERLGAADVPTDGFEPGQPPPLLLSDDGRTLLIRVAGVQQVDDLDFSRELTRRIDALATGVNQDGFDIQLAGGYAIAATTSQGVRADMIRSMVVAMICVHLLFICLYRRLLAPVLVAVTAGAGIVTGFGIHGMGGLSLTPLSAAIGAMLAGLGIDYGIHLLSHYQVERSRALNCSDAIRASVRRVGAPMLASALTTAIGFGTMSLAGVAMLRSFSVIGVVSLIGCLLAVVTVMPALLRLVDRDINLDLRPPRFHAVADFIRRRRRVCLTIGAVGVLAQAACLAASGAQLTMETDLSVMHPRPNPPLEATEQLGQRFGRLGETLPVEIRAQTAEDMLTATHAAARALGAPDARSVGVVGAIGVHSLLPDPTSAQARQQRLARLDPEQVTADFHAAVEDSAFRPDAFGDYADGLARAITSTPPGLADLHAYPAITRQFLPTHNDTVLANRSLLAVRLRDPLSNRAQRDEVVEGIRAALAPVPEATLSGVTAVAYDLERATRGDLPRLILLTVTLILACLCFILRRPVLVALALIPMLSGALLTITVVSVTGMRINALNGAALPLMLGITVDAGVFLVAYARGRSGRDFDAGASVQAVITASATTLLGFGAVCISSTPAIRSLGILACLGIAGSLWGTLLLLVPMLLTPRQAGDR